MIRFQADADVHRRILIAVRRREPAIDFASASESNLEGLPDPEVLEIAARRGRILITHDRRTMPGHFRERLAEGKSSSGVLIVSQFAPVGPVVESILAVWSASEPEEWWNQIHHLPSLVRHVFTR